jgi:hypothetical protein
MPLLPVFADVAPATRTVEKPRHELVAVGAVTLGATWLLSAGHGALSALGTAGHGTADDKGYYGWMMFPVAGPWVSLAYVNGSNSTGMRVLALASGTLQTVGMALIVLGVTWKRTEVVEIGSLRVTPGPLGAGAGVLAWGLF